MKLFKRFYSSLYDLKFDGCMPQPTLEQIQQFLQPLSLPKLNNDQLTELSHSFTEPEILTVINSLPSSKSPGTEGFPNEYYQILKGTLTTHLVAVYNLGFSTGRIQKKCYRL